ncbi:MAG TPA: hypothetical protein VG713_12290 [Pirellulales bacterium]|nr:hypothetical protein [Pirellulales bacterium]
METKTDTKPFAGRDLHRWLNATTVPCVTLYLPAHGAGNDGQQGRVVLKNLLARAEQTLEARGMRSVAARALLEPARKLVDDDRFWKDQWQGLMAVVTVDGVETWRLPINVAALVAVGDRVSIKQALPAVTDNQTFHLLAVSQNKVRLFRGDRWTLEPVALDTLPAGLVAALHNQPPQVLFQVLGAPSAARGQEGTVYHGQSGEVDAHKKELNDWFHLIDRALEPYLRGEKTPLVFAGVEYLFPIFRSACTYSHVFDQPVHGNPDQWSHHELQQRAAALLEPLWSKAAELDRTRFDDHLGSNRVSASIEEVLPAAIDGRVDALFVDRDRPLWGRFDERGRTVELLPDQTADGEDLLDRAAWETLRRRGRVYAVPGDQVPGGILISALYRYATQPIEAAGNAAAARS